MLSIRLLKPLATMLLAVAWLLPAAAPAQTPDGLLKVTDAFRLTASADAPGKVKLHWDIADDYYLYRGRIKVSVAGDAVEAGALALPDGEKEHDPYLGDVEIYHHAASATLPYTVRDPAADELKLDVTFQGCHEVDPKICYPPHTQTVTLSLPAAAHAASAGNMPTTEADRTATPDHDFTPPPGLLSGSAPQSGAGGKPLPPEQAFRFSAIATGPDTLLLRWDLPDGYYLYRDNTTLQLVDADGDRLDTPQWPQGVEHKDAYFGTTTVYFDQVEVPVALARQDTGVHRVTLEARFQGCLEDGICYPMMTRKVDIDLPAGAGADTTAAPEAQARSDVERLAGGLAGNGRWLALLGFFAAGLALAFTPCVLPMIPILSGLIAGAGESLSTARAFVLSVVYVLASSVVFVIAGVVAGLVGSSLQAAFQSPWLLGAFAALFVLLALSMFGFYELKLPAAMQNRLTAASNRQQGGSLTGVAIMGVLSALIVGPCVAPPLAGAVLYIAQSHDPVFGGLALFLLSLGMGVPLVIFGTAAGRWLPRAGQWMKTVQAVFGVLFLALAIWMLSRFVAPLWVMLMSGVLLVASGIYMGALDRLPHNGSGWGRLWKALGLVLMIFGAAELIGVSAGSRNLLAPLAGIGSGSSDAGQTPAFETVKSVDDLEQAVAAAQAEGKPVMLDFYADWCVSCKEMEQFTYSQPKVRDAMSRFVLLKADVTANDADDKALLKHFGLFGPPATIFYTADDGTEIKPLRLVGFEKADPFLQRLDKARSR